MFIIRNVFHCKPGKAKDLVQVFKKSSALMQEAGMRPSRVMTDLSATFWTVVFETEAESMEAWEKEFQTYSSKPEIQNAMKGYMEFVERGHREIWRVE
jgi:hypothetical protein